MFSFTTIVDAVTGKESFALLVNFNKIRSSTNPLQTVFLRGGSSFLANSLSAQMEIEFDLSEFLAVMYPEAPKINFKPKIFESSTTVETELPSSGEGADSATLTVDLPKFSDVEGDSFEIQLMNPALISGFADYKVVTTGKQKHIQL